LCAVFLFPHGTVEYAWQHPYNCRFTKARLVPLKGSKGLGHPRSVKRKLVELHEMLHVAPWDAFPLTVSYTTSCTWCSLFSIRAPLAESLLVS
jgi:hypothetical protein